MREKQSNDLDRRLVGYRVVKGFNTRTSVARAAELSTPTCWRMECTSRAVHPATLKKYGAAIGVSPEHVQMMRPQAEDAGVFELVVLILPTELAARLREQAEESRSTADQVAGEILDQVLPKRRRRRR